MAYTSLSDISSRIAGTSARIATRKANAATALSDAKTRIADAKTRLAALTTNTSTAAKNTAKLTASTSAFSTALSDLTNSVSSDDYTPTYETTDDSTAAELLAELSPIYTESIKTAMTALAPGWEDVMSGLESNISSYLSGELPADVRASIETTMAEKNLQSGRLGGIANSATALSLGLTSLDLSKYGTEQAQSYLTLAKSLTGDVSGLVSSQMSYNLTAAQIAAQKAQYATSLKASLETTAESNALDKLKLLLASNETTATLAENARQFDASLSWDKELSKWNLDYEKWALTEQSKLSQTLINSKAAAQGTSNSTLSGLMSKFSNALGGAGTVDEQKSSSGTSQSFGAESAQSQSFTGAAGSMAQNVGSTTTSASSAQTTTSDDSIYAALKKKAASSELDEQDIYTKLKDKAYTSDLLDLSAYFTDV